MKYVFDIHTHSRVSGHAYSTIREMAKSASEKGLELLGITEHAPAMPGTCHSLYFRNLKMITRQMEGIELMLGAELNILDYEGTIDLPEEILEKMDVVIASLHTPCITSGTVEENTRAFLNAMKNPYIDVIGHPDDIRYPVDYKALVYGAKESGKLLEVNNNSLDPRSTRKGGYENYSRMLEYCKECGQPIVVNSDAHVDQLVGNHGYAYQLIQELGFPEELVVNTDVAKLKACLRKYK